MKIRTDFVTNSSSSSFISYKVSGELVGKFLEESGIDLNCNALVNSEVEDDTVTINFDNEFSSRVSLPQMMMYAAAKSEYADDFESIEEINTLFSNSWDADEVEEKIRRLPKTKCEEYEFKTKYDGSEESAVKLIYELFANTDFESRVDVETLYVYGGGECDITDCLCGFESSGELIATDNAGRITRYAVHPYDGGWGFISDSDRYYIAYEDNTLRIRDMDSMCSSDWDISFTNEDVKDVINNICEKGDVLEKINEISCENVTEIDVPDEVLEVSEDAFQKCPSLKKVRFYRSNTLIGENAVPAGVEIVGNPNSSAQAYATENGNLFITFSQEQETYSAFVNMKEMNSITKNCQAETDQAKRTLGKYEALNDYLTIFCPTGSYFRPETEQKWALLGNIPTIYPGQNLSMQIRHESFSKIEAKHEGADGIYSQKIGTVDGIELVFKLIDIQNIFGELYQVSYNIEIVVKKLDKIYYFHGEPSFRLSEKETLAEQLKTACDTVSEIRLFSYSVEERESLNISQCMEAVDDAIAQCGEPAISEEFMKRAFIEALAESIGIDLEDDEDDEE